jgi:hypothetical protein
MKKFILLLFLSFIVKVNAQTFTFTTEHTTLSDTLGSEIIFDFILTNISQDTIIVYITRPYQVLPEGWESSLCFDISCFPPFIDSVETTEEFQSSPLAPGDVRDFSIHIVPNLNHGVAKIGVFAGNKSNRNDTMSVELTAVAELVGVNEEFTASSFRLLQNYPNPFNPSTDISFELDRPSYISLDVYNVNGEKVSTLLKGDYAAGKYNTRFNAEGLSSGVYIVRLNAGNKNSLMKILLEK